MLYASRKYDEECRWDRQFNCQVKKKKNIKQPENHCVEEIVGVIYPEELSLYRSHLCGVNIGFMYI